MNKDFTLLLLLQRYPVYQQFQILSRKDVFIDADIANLMSTTEKKVGSDVLDSIYAYATAAVRH